MFYGIPANSDLFDRDVIDEINNSFESIYDSISELKVPKLKYKYPIKGVTVTGDNSNIIITNRSFLIGRELILDITFEFKTEVTIPIYGKMKLARTNVNNPYNYWGSIIQAGGGLKNYRFYYNGFDIYITGKGDDEDGTVFKKDKQYIIRARIIMS